MAKYLGAVYRGAVYGNPPRLVYNAEPMEASAIDYGKIFVSWNPPSGSFTKIRLVRNNDNFSETEQDGVILWEQTSTTSLSGLVSRNSFTDGEDNYLDNNPDNDLPIASGQFIYYTIWIFINTNLWIAAGYATALMPENRGSQTKLFELLPKVYTSAEQSPTGVPSTTSFIYSFLQPFSFTYDQILTYAELIKASYGRRKTPPSLLPPLENNIGLYPERGLPYRNQKKLIREAIYLYQNKGTLTGIQNYIESLSNYAPVITVTPNIMLDVQDSSFTNGIGRWTTTHGTLTADSTKPGPTGTNAVNTVWSGRFVTSAGVVTKVARNNNVATITTTAPHGLYVGDSVTIGSVSIPDFNGVQTITAITSTTTFTYANTGINVAESTVTGTITNVSHILLGKDDPVKKGIPVSGSTAYRFSYYAASTSNGNVIADVCWHDYLGVQIGNSVQEVSINGTTGVYQRFFMDLTSPASAVYATIRFKFTTQNTYNIDMIQFATQATATNFDEARGLDIFLSSAKVNINSNPSFETNTTGWTTNSSVSRVADVPPGLPGAYSMQLSGQNNFSLTKILNKTPETFKIIEGNNYVFSCYLKASASATMTMNLTASDDDGVDSDLGTKQITVGTTWSRHYVSLFVPEGLSINGNITLTFNLSATLTGQTIWIDNTQAEQSFLPTDYFDGSLPADFGVFWSGTAHASYSYNYPSRLKKMPRIFLTLKDWVPYNMPYRVRSYKGLEGTSETVI